MENLHRVYIAFCLQGISQGFKIHLRSSAPFLLLLQPSGYRPLTFNTPSSQQNTSNYFEYSSRPASLRLPLDCTSYRSDEDSPQYPGPVPLEAVSSDPPPPETHLGSYLLSNTILRHNIEVKYLETCVGREKCLMKPQNLQRMLHGWRSGGLEGELIHSRGWKGWGGAGLRRRSWRGRRRRWKLLTLKLTRPQVAVYNQ